ncbi:hypothetical protein [Hydrogenophaga crocea]|uniref:Uncharacterized protein n=1 Tax=Hydrogenophaga crocea TaxID=2716225 RepID=A0A6G8IEK0_9BURK|nr:hypothetical protein [Hydrogenophaga crocea]QIM51617.1 hypothetical protein G9Q37_05425 [Hydrogenophaga crocea]
MATFNKIPGSREALVESINCGSDQWAIALTNTAPTGTAFTAGTSDLATGGGYTQGGANVTTTSSTESAGTYRLILSDPPTWTASGANIGPFRYATLVDKTVNLQVGYWDYGSSITLLSANSDTFTVDLDNTNGVISLG